MLESGKLRLMGSQFLAHKNVKEKVKDVHAPTVVVRTLILLAEATQA
jgi:hypothetical protein